MEQGNFTTNVQYTLTIINGATIDTHTCPSTPTPASVATCAITGLGPGKTFTVSATALDATNVVSQASGASTFKTIPR
jgi:hypothetical protein